MQQVLRINTMIQHIRICLCWNFRSVFVIPVSTILEGERDRLHFVLGIVNMVLVSITREVWKVVLLVEDRTVAYTLTSSLFAHNQENSDSVFHCCVRARIAFNKSKRLASTEQWHANNEVFLPCANVSVVSIYRTCVSFHIFHWWQIRYAHSGLSNICILCIQTRSTFIRMYDKRCDCHCRMELALSVKQPW